MRDDRLGHLHQRRTPLLDRVDQPFRRLNLALQELARLVVRGLVAQLVDPRAADVNVRRPVIEQPHLVVPILVPFHGDVRHDIRNVLDCELGAGTGIQMLQGLDRLLDGRQVKAGAFLNHR